MNENSVRESKLANEYEETHSDDGNSTITGEDATHYGDSQAQDDVPSLHDDATNENNGDDIKVDMKTYRSHNEQPSSADSHYENAPQSRKNKSWDHSNSHRPESVESHNHDHHKNSTFNYREGLEELKPDFNKVREAAPGVAEALGVNFRANSVGAVKKALNFLIYTRVLQFIFSILAWATLAAAIQDFKTTLDDIGQGSIDSTPFLSGVIYALVLMALLTVFSILTGLAGFLLLGGNYNTETHVKVFARFMAAMDLMFVFLTFSAFSSCATSTMVISGFADMNGVEFGSGKAAAGASFTIISWLTLCYSAALATTVNLGRNYLLRPTDFERPNARTMSSSQSSDANRSSHNFHETQKYARNDLNDNTTVAEV